MASVGPGKCGHLIPLSSPWPHYIIEINGPFCLRCLTDVENVFIPKFRHMDVEQLDNLSPMLILVLEMRVCCRSSCRATNGTRLLID